MLFNKLVWEILVETTSPEKTLLDLLLLVHILRRARSFRRGPNCFSGKSATTSLCSFLIALFGFFFTVAYGDGAVRAGSVFEKVKHLSMFALSHG